MMERFEAWRDKFSGEPFGVALIVALVLIAILSTLILQRWTRRFMSRRRAAKLGANVISIHDRRRARRARSTRRPVTRRLGPFILVVMALLLVLSFELLPYLGLNDTTLSGRVTHVRDGDTIEVNGQAIRLNGLTCDERGTPLGTQATMAMQALASGAQVTCTLTGEQTYDREVGRCVLSDGRDLGAEMIAQGVCGRCGRYDPLRTYAAAQQEAGPFAGAYPGYCRSPW